MNRVRIIVIQQKTKNSGWSDFYKCHAKINKFKGAEALDGAAVQSPEVLLFDVRFCSKLSQLRQATQDFRILYQNKKYKIVSYDDVFEKRKNIRLRGESYVG